MSFSTMIFVIIYSYFTDIPTKINPNIVLFIIMLLTILKIHDIFIIYIVSIYYKWVNNICKKQVT